MTKAIEIVNEMMKVVDSELDRLSASYAKTSPTNIYDAGYRRTLENLEDIQIRKYNTLREVKMALENEMKKDFAEGFDTVCPNSESEGVKV